MLRSHLLFVVISFCQQAPAFTIASNAGADAALVIGKLLEQHDLNFGYDAAKGLCSSGSLFLQN